MCLYIKNKKKTIKTKKRRRNETSRSKLNTKNKLKTKSTIFSFKIEMSIAPASPAPVCVCMCIIYGPRPPLENPIKAQCSAWRCLCSPPLPAPNFLLVSRHLLLFLIFDFGICGQFLHLDSTVFTAPLQLPPLPSQAVPASRSMRTSTTMMRWTERCCWSPAAIDSSSAHSDLAAWVCQLQRRRQATDLPARRQRGRSMGSRFCVWSLRGRSCCPCAWTPWSRTGTDTP